MGLAKVLKCVASDNQDNTVLAINIAVKGILCAIIIHQKDRAL